MPQAQNPVVASLGERSPHPYSSVALSPNRKLAIVTGKDTLQLIKVGPSGLSEIRSMRISQHFQPAAAVAAAGGGRAQIGNFYEERQRSFVRDTFGMVDKQAVAQTPRAAMTNVVLTDVAWSPKRYLTRDDGNLEHNNNHNNINNNAKEEVMMAAADTYNPNNANDDDNSDSIIASAGSNGVVVVWSAQRAFFKEQQHGESSSSQQHSSMADQQPEAILREHSRAVNRLAWHPRKHGLLLTASQDATVKLWVRRTSTHQDHPSGATGSGYLSWFRLSVAPSMDVQSYSWQCRNTFEPKSEAVRDVRWSPFQNDIFAIVTVSGSLIVYNMYVKGKAIVKISAHAGDATTLDWHPTRPGIVATGSAGDRCVKIWDMGSLFSLGNDDTNLTNTSNTANSRTDSLNTDSSSETDRSGYASSTIGSSSGQKTINASRSVTMLHILSVSATVTRLRWRPPALQGFPSTDDEEGGSGGVDRHDSMLAVATVKSTGGSGVLSLWSYHRPYMPLSVLEGHKEGSVTDFFFVDTPQNNNSVESSSSHGMRHRHYPSAPSNLESRRRTSHIRANSDDHDATTSLRGVSRGGGGGGEGTLPLDNYDIVDSDDQLKTSAAVCIWQHVLSVGRDGRCLLQSFVRGDRPISRVPPSCFSMANYSPFQRGYGSLQIFSVHQKLPSGPKNDFFLTGLRQDAITARAPGVFRELPPTVTKEKFGTDSSSSASGSWAGGKRLPDFVPELVFNVVDEGQLDQGGTPVDNEGIHDALMIAPEVVHLSRFAKALKFYPDEECRTRVDLCLHNGHVAERLRCGSLARMWMSVASMLHGSGLDELPQKGSLAGNVMQFVLLPTLKSLLEERADGGDVQTCVALCEVLQVIQPDQTTRIPGLDLNLVREWYLSYIDLLRDMCLFSLAAFLIRSCKDPFIGALNQQSTTIHESCPSCGKPLQPSDSSFDGITSSTCVIARRACKTCRRRVGLCFVCHEPVKGMFVWCPGCGHGGHLEHALEWFGGMNGQPIRETCPTGCGHRCNLSQPISAFPRTDSVQQMP